MDRRNVLALMVAGLVAGPAGAHDLKSVLGSAMGGHKASNLSKGDADAGLRDALSRGTVNAVLRVSQPNGYWGDDVIRIPLPKSLAGPQKLLKPMGMSGPLDEVHERMNHAAETAAPLAKALFLDAIRSMTIDDAIGIVRGGPTSGTDYLQRTTTPRLTDAFTPPMEHALRSTGAVQALGEAVKRNNLQGVVKEDPGTYIGRYAVGLALDGLFHYVGTEEASIRRDPGKTGSQLLKTVFG